MELTIENLLAFLNDQYSDCFFFKEDSDIRGMGIDGLDAEDMIRDISKKFNIDFHDFPFEKYFLYEIEITRKIAWFGLKKLRIITDRITPYIIYEFMNSVK